MSFTLVVANKTYSSWSLRPWILLEQFHLPFDEVTIALREPQTRENLLRYSPSGKAPVLIDGDCVVWDSLAIIEYIAEIRPDLAIWPREKTARAMARAASAEMHSSFQALRAECPMNFRRAPKSVTLTDDLLADVARIEAIWAAARTRFGQNGPFLYGEFCAADAMFAPIVNRFDVYALPVSKGAHVYMEAMKGLPSWQKWALAAAMEPWKIEAFERS